MFVNTASVLTDFFTSELETTISSDSLKNKHNFERGETKQTLANSKSSVPSCKLVSFLVLTVSL